MRRRGKRQTRFGRWVERVALGVVMGAVAFVAERRLLKVLRRREREESPEPRRTPERDEIELSLPAKDVDNQPAGEQASRHPQDRR